MSTILNAHQYEYARYDPIIECFFFGTLIAAPLIVSKKAKKRLFGLMAVITGSFFAIIVQLYLGLYYFVFANSFWLLNALNGIKKIRKEQRRKINEL